MKMGFSYHIGNVRCLLGPTRLREILVEHGTASKWCELLGNAGTQSLLRLGFASLRLLVSVFMATALYFASRPSRISSTSVALRRVTLVARPCWPNPVEIEMWKQFLQKLRYELKNPFWAPWLKDTLIVLYRTICNSSRHTTQIDYHFELQKLAAVL